MAARNARPRATKRLASWTRPPRGRPANATSSRNSSDSATRSPTAASARAVATKRRPRPWRCHAWSAPWASRQSPGGRRRRTTPRTSRFLASCAGSEPCRRRAGRRTMTEGRSADRLERFRAARAAVLARIEAASLRAGRDPSGVTLIAVSKTVDVDTIRDALAAGLDLLGENRVQEAEAKAPLVPGGRWHLVGPLQGNKVRRALDVFEVIQSVDSVGLAERIDRLARERRPGEGGPGEAYPVLLQVNVDGDPAKAGFDPGYLGAEIGRIA